MFLVIDRVSKFTYVEFQLGKFNQIGHWITGERTDQSNTRGVGWRYVSRFDLKPNLEPGDPVLDRFNSLGHRSPRMRADVLRRVDHGVNLLACEFGLQGHQLRQRFDSERRLHEIVVRLCIATQRLKRLGVDPNCSILGRCEAQLEALAPSSTDAFALTKMARDLTNALLECRADGRLNLSCRLGDRLQRLGRHGAISELSSRSTTGAACAAVFSVWQPLDFP
jgi:hypothetical protein